MRGISPAILIVDQGMHGQTRTPPLRPNVEALSSVGRSQSVF